MGRAARIAKWTLAGLAGFILLLVLVVALFDWNYLRPWVAQKASDALQRPVSIEGDLDVEWQWRGGGLPWPHITARQIVAGHPEGFAGTEENMAEIDFLAVSVNPMPLFRRHVEIPRLEIGDSRIFLQRNNEGENNWVYERKQVREEDEESSWTVDLQSVALRRVDVQVTDDERKLNMRTRFNSLDTDDENGYGMDWESSGSFNDADVAGGGKVGGLLSLREGGKPFPLQGEVSFGETRIAVEGSMTAPKGLASLDVKLKLAGSSLSDLNALFGMALPTTPPFSTEGRLLGMLDTEEDTWRYEEFRGMVGESDLGGTVEYRQREPRPLLTGVIASNLLRFKDLGPLIGADTSDVEAEEKKEEEEKPEDDTRKQPPDKALPVARIGSESWDMMDADVRFEGRRIVRDEDLPLDDIEAHVRLQDRVLSFEPLNFGVAGGTLVNRIRIDGKGEVLHADMSTEVRGLQLKQLFPGTESMSASFGQLHGDAKLKGSGDSIASLLGSSNGDLSLAVSRGTISRFLLEAAGLNVANVIFVKLFGDEQVMLECLVADFGIKNGVMQTRALVIETEDAVIEVDGNVSLKDETLDLDIRPQNKTLRIFTLRSPLYAKGTFKDPKVGVQPAPIAARAGAAVALGVVATPLAALLPLLNVGTDDAGCSTARGDGKSAKSDKEDTAKEEAAKKDTEEDKEKDPAAAFEPKDPGG